MKRTSESSRKYWNNETDTTDIEISTLFTSSMSRHNSLRLKHYAEMADGFSGRSFDKLPFHGHPLFISSVTRRHWEQILQLKVSSALIKVTITKTYEERDFVSKRKMQPIQYTPTILTYNCATYDMGCTSCLVLENTDSNDRDADMYSTKPIYYLLSTVTTTSHQKCDDINSQFYDISQINEKMWNQDSAATITPLIQFIHPHSPENCFALKTISSDLEPDLHQHSSHNNVTTIFKKEPDQYKSETAEDVARKDDDNITSSGSPNDTVAPPETKSHHLLSILGVPSFFNQNLLWAQAIHANFLESTHHDNRHNQIETAMHNEEKVFAALHKVLLGTHLQIRKLEIILDKETTPTPKKKSIWNYLLGNKSE